MAVESGRGQAAQPPVAVEAGSVTGAAGTGGGPEFVGRDETLAAVVGALRDGPALVVVEGEAGIGKTRLLRECLRSASFQGRRVLVAACPALLEPFPLGAVVDGVRRLRPDIAQLGLSPLGGALRSLFPEWMDVLPPALEALDDSKETRHRLFGALTELVDRLGVELLVVEDVHWADTATLEWLLTLTAVEPATDDHDRSVVVSYRPWDIPDGSLLPRLTSRSPTGLPLVRVELQPLTTEHTQQLVASMLSADDVSERFAEFLCEHTGGVPLALEEYLLLLQDREDIVPQGGTWARRVLDELEVPATVRDSVLERVARLRPEARRVLEAAAVLAGPADAAILTAVAELDDGAGRHGLAAALASGLLQETDPGRYVFRHALDVQAIGDAIPVSERRRVHLRAGLALETLDHPPVARLAHHYREVGDTERWCHYAEAAADLALESGDDRTAVTVLHDLLTSIDHSGERARLARKLGQAAVNGSAVLGELRVQLVATLRTVLGSSEIRRGERGEIRLLLGRLLSGMDEPAAAFAEFEAAIPDLQERPALVARAMLYLAWPLAGAHPASWYRAWLDRAAALLPHIESSAERLWCSAYRATALLMLGDEAGWQAAEDLSAPAVTRAEQQPIALGMLNVAQFLTLHGRLDEARSCLDAGRTLAQDIGYWRCIDIAKIARAHLDYYSGAWGGLAGAAEALAESEDARPATRLEARLIQALLELAAGARAAAEQRLRTVMAGLGQRGHGGPLIMPLAAAALARMSLADGAANAALAMTEPEVALIARKQVWLWATDIAPVHVQALVAADKPGEAGALVEQFAEGLAGRYAPAPAAALVQCRGIVAEARGDLSQAIRLFAEAAKAWAALPRPYDELLTLERRGRCLLAMGEQDDGLALLSDTEQRLRDLGAKWDADRVAHLLREHGVEVARAWRGGRRGYGDQLSPRELEVVHLVARGMTNKQIAESLYISPGTVKRHLQAAMGKLGVSSRTALAMAASEAGLLSER